MTNSDDTLILKKYPLWATLSNEEYHELDVSNNFKQATEGEFIYFEAFNHNNIYFLKNGNIRLGYLDQAGNKIIKDVLCAGDFFGQISLEKDNLDGEFAQAVKSDVSICAFTIDSFNALLKKKPELAISYSKMIGLRMRRFQNRLVNILQKDARTRLLLFLQQLLHDAPEKMQGLNNDIQIPGYLTHEEIGQLIGSSRQTVTTILNDFKEEGLLKHERKIITFHSSPVWSNNYQ